MVTGRRGAYVYGYAGGMSAYILNDRALGAGGGHFVVIDLFLRRDGSSKA
jgi:hypothetical protein